MDVLSQHEAFLRAIFDAPDDDTPRLVYADFLQENGEEARAEFIRVQCELPAVEAAYRSANLWESRELYDEDRLKEYYDRSSRCATLLERSERLAEQVIPWRELTGIDNITTTRGFWHDSSIEGVAISADELANPRVFREWVVRVNPAWYGERKLFARGGERFQSSHIHAIYALPFTQQITDWNLAGRLEEYVEPADEWMPLDVGGPRPGDMVIIPTMTDSAIDGLTRHRGARRIRTLDLRNNRLGSDAARLLVESPYLDNLKRLRLLEGNHLRGKVWQQVIERFGEDVVE